MGLGMASNLAKSEHSIITFDLSKEALEKAAAAGCEPSESVRGAVERADIVISMLPNGKIVEDVYTDKDKLFDVIPTGALIIDCSTVSPETSRRLASEGGNRGLEVIDAPVSGGTAAAASGSLSFMCGGQPPVFEKAKPILSLMGHNVFYAGDSGAGQVAKICNNMLLSILMVGTAEAIQLGVNNGLDPAVLSEIMSCSSGNNWVLQKYNPYPGVNPDSPATRGYTGGFLVNLMCKDLGLAMRAALDSDSHTPMGALANNLYSLHKDQLGYANGDLDFSSIQKMFPDSRVN